MCCLDLDQHALHWLDPESLFPEADLDGGPCAEEYCSGGGIIIDANFNGTPTAETTLRMSMRISQLPLFVFLALWVFLGVDF